MNPASTSSHYAVLMAFCTSVDNMLLVQTASPSLQVVIMADGQVTRNTEIVKPNVKKVRTMIDGSVIGGFAGECTSCFSCLSTCPGMAKEPLLSRDVNTSGGTVCLLDFGSVHELGAASLPPSCTVILPVGLYCACSGNG